MTADPQLSAEVLRHSIQPAADAGNPLASFTLHRLAVADDPDAEARQIIHEWKSLLDGLDPIIEALGPLARFLADTRGGN
jgi:hypothetical protein